MNRCLAILSLFLLVTLGAEWLHADRLPCGRAKDLAAWAVCGEVFDGALDGEDPGTPCVLEHEAWLPGHVIWRPLLAVREFQSSRPQGASGEQHGAGLRLHRYLCVERC